MAIPGQQNINIGLPNQSANSDSLYTAFRAVQNNFTALFSAASPITLIEAGNGINITAPNSSSYTITNTGVTKLIAGNGVTITTEAGSPANTGTLIINSTGGGGGGSGTVTSVGVASNTLSVSASPIVTSGNILVDLPNIVAAGNYVTPNITVDNQGRITSISNGLGAGTVTSVGLLGGAGIAIAGGPITSSGEITVTNTGVTSIVPGTGVTINQSNGAVTISAVGGGNGGGTVTRVGIVSNTLSVSGSPVISAGNIQVDLPNTLSVTQVNTTISNAVTALANQFVGNSGNQLNSVIDTVYSGNTANTSAWIARRNRGTPSGFLPVQVNDTLLSIQTQGRGSFGQYQPGANINIIANALAGNSAAGIPSEIHFNVVEGNNIPSTVRITDTGALVVPGVINNSLLTNIDQLVTNVTARGRGSSLLAGNVIVGDVIFKHSYFGYTGNGNITINGLTGYAFAGGIESIVQGLPSVPTGNPSMNLILRTTSNSNVIHTATLTSTGNFDVTGIFNGGGSGLANINGSNVQGAVPFATVANSVAGANVTGTVPFANIANRVAGANVLGKVSSASVADVANLVQGANVNGTVTSAFSVVTANQPNITAVGTLTSLTVSGEATVGSLSINSAPSANTTATVVATIPIEINGVMYKLMLASGT